MEASHPTNATNMCRDAFLQLRDAGFRSADRRSDALLDGKSSESEPCCGMPRLKNKLSIPGPAVIQCRTEHHTLNVT